MQILNKKARFNYNLLERIEAGIQLSGSEVKTLKMGRADLSNSYARILNSELYLVNANIPAQGGPNYNPTRTRRLLIHKYQIISISTKIKQQSLTLVPTKIYTKKKLLKVEIALAKPKRKFEKRLDIKRKDIEREIAQALRGKE